MKLPFSRSTRNFLIVSLVLAGLHLAASIGCSWLFHWADHLMYRSSIPYFLMDKRLLVVREIAMAGLTFLHLPAVLLTNWLASSVEITMPDQVWALYVIDALLIGFGLATLVRWLRRPPRMFSRNALPLFGRQTVSLTIFLATLHFLSTGLIYFGSRWMAAQGVQVSPWSGPMLAALHPWVLVSGMRMYAAANPYVISIAIADALIWGVLVAWALTAIRQRLF